MLIIIGSIIVFVSAMGGFMIAGGSPMVLLHVSEFVVIGGVAAGIMVISTPFAVMKQMMADLMASLKGPPVTKDGVVEVLKLLYELFMAGRRNGLLALDDHMSDPQNSAILTKYPTFIGDPQKVSFLVNSMRPIIDGKIKPEQLASILQSELKSMHDEQHKVIGVFHLVGDSLPGVGIVAAVLGIINTMGSISEGPDAVGHKVAAALTGTFLGIFAAYGFINPIGMALEFRYGTIRAYYHLLVTAITSFTKGMSPIMALEVARRALPDDLMITADELEEFLKELN